MFICVNLWLRLRLGRTVFICVNLWLRLNFVSRPLALVFNCFRPELQVIMVKNKIPATKGLFDATKLVMEDGTNSSEV